MTKTTLILLFSFFTITLNAQRVNLDSLNKVWFDKTQPDTNRFQALQRIAWNGHLFSKPDTIYMLGQQLVDAARDRGNKKWEAKGVGVLAKSFLVEGNYVEALKYFMQSSKIEEEIDDQQGLAFSLDNIANIYRRQGRYKSALEYFLRSLSIKQDNKDLAYSYAAIGSIYVHQGKYEEAYEYHGKALEIREEIGDKRRIASSLNSIGGLYSRQNKFEEAFDYYYQGLSIRKEIEDEKGIASSVVNIGNNYFQQSKYKEALEYYQRGLELNEQMGDERGKANAFVNIGITSLKLYNYSEALKNGEKSLEIAKKLGLARTIRSASMLLSELYEKQGDGMKALDMYKMYFEMTDSLKSEETVEQLRQMEFDKRIYQDSIANTEKERLIREAHQAEVRQKNKTRNILFGAMGLLLLLAVGVFSRLQYTRKAKAVLQVEKDRSENLLLNILPKEIAEELKENGKANAQNFDLVSILFTDFKGFTELSATLSASELVEEINTCFKAFDGIIEKYEVEKIKTIGDAYMAAGGVPVPDKNAAKNTVLAALEMQAFVSKHKVEMDAIGKPSFEMRLGIHTGPVVAGIVGVKKFQYDIWGDAVNTASRMESNGAVGKVNISQRTYDLIKDDPDFHFESRGKIEAKGKGELIMWFVSKS